MICKKCGEDKEADAFSIHKQCKSGYDTSACKKCKKSAVDWSSVPLERRMYNRVKSRAKKKGIPFNLCQEDIILPDRCPVFNQPFIYGDTDWTYSIDRIIPKMGYVKGNIVIISNKANRSKNNLTLFELKQLVEFLEKGACEIPV